MPYRIEDLITVIDDRMGKLENRSRTTIYNKLLQRIKTFRNHPRYGFMFENATVGGDTMAEVVSHLFRIPANGKPMTIMQLAGFPAEVVDSVVSVLSRMAFDFGLWSDGASPLLFVCEEAHRYAPADRKIGFGPTRRALSRIAKEGRKYGVFLGLVTQRPAEIDPTIISQCSTMFVMRLSNDRDQALIRSAVSDAGASMLTFVPSLGTGEVFAFGAGVPLPTRMKFREVPLALRPTSEAGGNTRLAAGASPDRDMIDSVIDRWRAATMSHKGQFDDDGGELGSLARRHPGRAAKSVARAISPRRRSQPACAAHAFTPVFEPQPPPGARRRRRSRGPASCAGRISSRAARPEQSGAVAQPLPVEPEPLAAAPKIALPTRTCVAPIAMATAIVRAHAHRQQLQPVARGDLGGQREMRRRRLVGRRNAHQPGDRQPVVVAAARQERVGVLRQHAGLLRLGAGVDLDEQQRPCGPAWRSPWPAPRTGSAGRPNGWRRTAPPPPSPCSIAAGRSCAARCPDVRCDQRRPFRLGLLHAVFAEHALARRRSPARWRRRRMSSTPRPRSPPAGSRDASRQARAISWRTAARPVSAVACSWFHP